MPEHTIAENLSRLITAKTDIANAITTMGGVVGENDGFEEFPADILGIPSGVEIYDLRSSVAISDDLHAIYCDQKQTLYVFGTMKHNNVYTDRYIYFPCQLSDMGVTSQTIKGYLYASYYDGGVYSRGGYKSLTPTSTSIKVDTLTNVTASVIGVFA